MSRQPTLTGYAVIWGAISQTPADGCRERFLRGTFVDSIARDDISALWKHNVALEFAFKGDPTQRLNGKAMRGGRLDLWEDVHGLAFEIEPYEDLKWIDSIVSQIRDRRVRGMSFGYRRLESIIEVASSGGVAHTVRTTSRAQLLEVSPVYAPNYLETSVRLVEPLAAKAPTVEPASSPGVLQREVIWMRPEGNRRPPKVAPSRSGSAIVHC